MSGWPTPGKSANGASVFPTERALQTRCSLFLAFPEPRCQVVEIETP